MNCCTACRRDKNSRKFLPFFYVNFLLLFFYGTISCETFKGEQNSSLFLLIFTILNFSLIFYVFSSTSFSLCFFFSCSRLLYFFSPIFPQKINFNLFFACSQCSNHFSPIAGSMTTFDLLLLFFLHFVLRKSRKNLTHFPSDICFVRNFDLN